MTWYQATPAVKSALIIQKRRNEMENERDKGCATGSTGTVDHLGQNSPANMEGNLKNTLVSASLCDTNQVSTNSPL